MPTNEVFTERDMFVTFLEDIFNFFFLKIKFIYFPQYISVAYYVVFVDRVIFSGPYL